jgi:prepilin-type N-terminal cleavage/methylation domain-containing protein
MTRSCRGMTLIECTAALALAGLAALAVGAMVQTEMRANARLDAEHRLSSALEYALETVRSGDAFNTPGQTELALPAPLQRPDRPITLIVTVSPAAQVGLTVVAIEGRCSVLGAPLVRRVETMTWRQP